MKYILSILIATMLSAPVTGQAVNSKDQMKKLSLWPGHWTGSSVWSMRGKDEPATVDEVIEWRVDGHALLINGLGKGSDGRIAHEALGVLSFDTRENKYRFHSWLRDGRSSDAWFNVVADNNFQWGFETPQGKIKYTIWLTEKTWKETGEFSSDGTQWHQFFTMNLTKTE